MKAIQVITDSTADLSAEFRERYDITVVPLSVTIGDETVPDGTYSQQEFFARMNAAPELPKTSQPSVGAFKQAYEKALETADEVISVHISQHLSGTLESAREAAVAFPGRVHVVDSLNLSWGLGWQVLEAARAAAEGISSAEVIERVERLRDQVYLIVGLEKLDNLAKGGRIGRVTAFLGSMLNMRVTFWVKEGKFEPLGRARGSQAILQQMVDWVGERMGERRRGRFCVLHALAPEQATWLRQALEQRFEIAEMHTQEVGTVIATHTGVGFGIAFVPLD